MSCDSKSGHDMPLSAADNTAARLRRLLGALPTRPGRGGGHNRTEAALG
jgi:hypothetical protein